MVFSPNTLKGAPHRMLTTLEFPKGTPADRESKVIQALAERFPLVTAIKVGDIVDAAKELLGKVMTAIRVTAGVTLLIGAPCLPARSPPARSGANIWRCSSRRSAPRAPASFAPSCSNSACSGWPRRCLPCDRHGDRLGALQMGLRRGVRVLAAGRRGNGAAGAGLRARRRRGGYLAGAVGQGGALSAGRIRVTVRLHASRHLARDRLSPPYSWPKCLS